MEVRKIIIEGFKNGKLTGKTEHEIASALKLSPSYKKTIKAAVRKLRDEGVILKDGNGRYGTPESMGAFKARVKGNAQGFAFLIPDGYAERERDYFVPKKRLKGALDGDAVLAVPTGGDEAAIVEILSRGKNSVIGVLRTGGRCAYVIPDDKAYCGDVYIHPSLLNGADDGDKVIVDITAYNRDLTVSGKVREILGRHGDFTVEENAIIARYELRADFPPYVTGQAEKVAGERVELKGRRDLRGLLTVTIDGADTRDIDDAISLQREGDRYVLGVHIADVSHYVKYNGCIDKEAYARGTSVYFPDRVLPMLPKALSNGACSLNEGELRYAISCFMTFDADGKKLNGEICESVIRSDKKMTYDEVTRILESGGAEDKNYPEIAPMLRDMATLCERLENRRQAAGEVNLDVKEAHICINERGEIEIPDYERTLSHRIIEQFMVSANETVAQFAERRGVPFLYRVHERPTPEKAEILKGFLSDLGIRAKFNAEAPAPCEYRNVLRAVGDKPYASVVNKVMLRSMQKARYDKRNLGHFGLASKCYCHFTSPIRRYPDLFVHRVLKGILHGETEDIKAKFTPVNDAAAIDTSERERVADAVERDVDDLYKVAYMQGQIGKEFDAVISGVIESGVFCELANTIEGMVRTETLPDDRYELNAEKFTLAGRRHSYRLGDKVRVKVVGADFGTRRVQFIFV